MRALLITLLFCGVSCPKLHAQSEINSPYYSNEVKKSIRQKKIGQQLISELDSAVRYSDINPSKALNFLTNIKSSIANNRCDKRTEASYFFTLGLVNFYLSEYNESLKYFYKSLDIRRQTLDPENISLTLNAIGNVFYYTGSMDEALSYYEEALVLNRKHNNVRGEITNLGNLSALFTDTREYKRAEEVVLKALCLLSKEQRISQTSANLYGNLSVLYKEQNLFSKALTADLKALKIIEQLDNAKGMELFIINNITEDYLLLKQIDSARKYFSVAKKSLSLIKPHDLAMQCYKNGILIYANLGLSDSIFTYFKYYFEIQKMIHVEEKQKQMVESKIKYETEETEKENTLSKLEIEKQKNLIYGFIIMIFFILFVIAYLYFRYRIKKKESEYLERKVFERTEYLQREIAERIKIEQNLKKAESMAQKLEKELLTATISAEEKERKRFAEELHDGLGVLLSTTKMYVHVIKKKIADKGNIPSDIEVHIETLTGLLEDAIKTSKEIANNLIPSILHDYGLVDTLSIWIHRLNQSKKLNIIFEAEEKYTRLDPQIELALYRIATELLNNTLKHAKASTAKLFIEQKQELILFSYHDNGMGFNWEEGIESDSMGLKNIISHTKSISGKYNVYAKKQEGFFFELTLKQDI